MTSADTSIESRVFLSFGINFTKLMYHAQRVPTFTVRFVSHSPFTFITYVFISEDSRNIKWGVEPRSVLCPGALVERI